MRRLLTSLRLGVLWMAMCLVAWVPESSLDAPAGVVVAIGVLAVLGGFAYSLSEA